LDVAVPSVSPVLTPGRSTSPSSFAKLRIDGEEFVCVVAFVTIGPYIQPIMTTLSHLFPIKILPEDIDFMGHVNNSRYLNWVQEAVLEHWRNLAPPDAVAARAWVALKHEITYRKPAFLEDDVVANVVLEKIHGARAFYDTVIKRGEEVLAEVKSSWCCIDADTLRPARISADVSAYFFPKAD
jgi:acyl-CoA thioester hydrolase